MKKKKPTFQKFKVPDSFLDNLFEMSGGKDKNKGYFLCFIDEDGNGQIKHKYDSQASEFAIMKFLDVYMMKYQNMQDIQSSKEFFDEDEDED
jgi:hypothetical protein